LSLDLPQLINTVKIAVNAMKFFIKIGVIYSLLSDCKPIYFLFKKQFF
jgi:hypothetical protein